MKVRYNHHVNTKTHTRKKQRNNLLKKMSILILSLLLLALPIQTSFKGLDMLGFEASVAHAQSLKDVNLLQRTNIHAGMKGTMGDNTFSVNVSGPVSPNINLIKSENVINYHLDLGAVPDGVREKIELTSVQDGQVTVTFDPISLSLISIELQDSFNFLSESIQSSTIKVLGFIDRIMDNKFFKFFVTIDGMREYLQAFDEFNKLQNRPQSIPDYNGNVPVFIDNDTHTVSIEFTDELNNHVTKSLEDRVLTVTNTFTDSIKNINIEILPNVPFLNKLSVLVNGIYAILTDIVEDVNHHILGPIGDGVLDATNLSNEMTITGQVNATTTLQFDKAIGICEGTESVGHGTFPVTVRGLVANQVVNGPDLFFDLNATDEVTIIVLPHENCLMESMKPSTTNFGDRFDIGGIKGLDRFIDPSELILIEEEIEENNEAEKEFDSETAKDFARENKQSEQDAQDDDKPRVDRGKEGRGTTQQRTESEKNADGAVDEAPRDADDGDKQLENDVDAKTEDDAKTSKSFTDRVKDVFKPRKDPGGKTIEPNKDLEKVDEDADQGTEDKDKSSRDLKDAKRDNATGGEAANKPQVDRDGSKDKANRNTQQRTESDNKSGDETEGEGDSEKAGADAKAGGDDKQTENDAKSGGDASGKNDAAKEGTQDATNQPSGAQDATGSESESSPNIDIDMDDIEEGIGLLQRLLEIIMKIIEALTNKETT